MKDMEPSQIVGSGKAYTLQYHGGTKRKIIATDLETEFPTGKPVVSTADIEGNIIKCNDAFIALSGYTKEELIGQPHCILRHPDMPKAAFADLWETIQAGKKWQGLVKNLRKDGGYYWVSAVVVADMRDGKIAGYTSVRKQPTRQQIAEIIPVYASMKAKEG